MSQPGAAAQQHPQQQEPYYHKQQHCAPLRCIPSHMFWVVAGASWVVWAFAVGAAVDDKWLNDNVEGGRFAAGEDELLNGCANRGADDDGWDQYEDAAVEELEEKEAELCDIYVAFTAMQFIATIVCSISVVLLNLAFFRPFAAGGLSSARALAFTGGGLMATYALFQLVAVALFAAFERTYHLFFDEATEVLGYDDGSWYESELGPSFAVGVCGLIFGTAEAVLLLLLARLAGDGPLHPCCHGLMLANRENGGVFGGGEGAGGGKTSAAPPMPTATVAPPPPAYGSA